MAEVHAAYAFVALTGLRPRPPRPMKPHSIWCACVIVTPRSSANVHTRPGFFWKWRPTKITSAEP